VGAYFEPVIQMLKPAWRVGFYRAKVKSIQPLTNSTLSIWLAVDKSWPVHKAGQHIQLTVEVNGKLITRIFTIASSPAEAIKKRRLRLVVKQQSLGQLTPQLTTLTPGDWLNISKPNGNFTLENVKSKSLFLAAGSGITPFISMLSALNVNNSNEHKLHLIYYAKQGEHLLIEQLHLLAKQHEQFTFELLTRAIDGDVESKLTDYNDTDLFVCGPAPFYYPVAKFAEAKQLELFSEHFSALPIETESKASFNLLFKGQSRVVNNSSSILTQLLEQGEQMTFGCKMGVCRQCQCIKTKGRVKNLLTGKISDTGEELIQLCTSQAITNLELKA
jgi:ferredoxin-NADP reductase